VVKITAFKNRNLTILSIAFGLLFFGFQAAEQHFTAYYQTIGKVNLAFQTLAILYASIMVGKLVGPAAVRFFGIKHSLIFGFLTYVALVFGMTLKIPHLIFLLSFVLGIGNGLLGIARIDFLRLVSPIDKRGEFAGATESVRTFGGFVGIAAVSLLLKFLKIDQTFLLLGVVMLGGTFMLTLLKKTGDNFQAPVMAPNFKKTITLMKDFVYDKRLLLLVPGSVAGGFLLGLVLGAIPAIIGKNFGILWVGVITSIFHLTMALVTVLAGRHSDIKGRFIFIYSAAFASIFATLLFLNIVSLLSIAIVMFILGLGGSLRTAAFEALMLDTFEDKVKEASAVLGNYGLLLGVVPSFLLAQKLSQNQLLYIAIGLSIAGIISLRVFEKRFAS